MIVFSQEARASLLKRRGKGQRQPDGGHDSQMAADDGTPGGAAARAAAWTELSGPERAALENAHRITWDADAATLRRDGEPVTFAAAQALMRGTAEKAAPMPDIAEGPGEPLGPGELSPGTLRRAYLDAGHAAPSPGHEPPVIRVDLSGDRGMMRGIIAQAPSMPREAR
jgi:hypothetical protein